MPAAAAVRKAYAPQLKALLEEPVETEAVDPTSLGCNETAAFAIVALVAVAAAEEVAVEADIVLEAVLHRMGGGWHQSSLRRLPCLTLLVDLQVSLERRYPE